MNAEVKKELEKNINDDIEKRKIEMEFPIWGVIDNQNSSFQIDNHLQSKLDQALDEMNKIKINIAYRPLISTHKLVGPFIVFFKKAVRKVLLKWYVEPVCFQQSDFNQATTRGIEAVYELYNLANQSTQDKILQNSEEIASISTKIPILSAEFKKEIEKIQTQEISLCHRASALENAFDNNMDSQKYLYDLNARLNQVTKRLDELENHDSLDDVKKISESLGGLVLKVDELETSYKNVQEKAESVAEIITRLNMVGIDLPDQTNCYRYTSSQAGEDTIVRYLLGGLGIDNKDCTYLDLGANHAIELSNTYWLYKQGARGVLVEPNAKLISELQLYRGHDIILQKCISDKSGQMVDFYEFREDGLSTISWEEAQHCLKVNENLHLQNTYKVETITVQEIIETYFKESPILLNLDIEGMELSILKSINFSIIRPAIIIVETIPYQKNLVIGEKDMDIVNFMNQSDYAEYAFTGINSIFIDIHRLK